ncbi:MAG: hypothetical protein N2491_08615 [Negativicutes bacterium]|nr:hypothetical protein [Negativicutes bacterium]
MYVLGLFPHSRLLEMAIGELVAGGIRQERILAVPMEGAGFQPPIIDTLRRADGDSLIDAAAISGTIFMLFGIIYGYVLEWGPIIWGLIGLFTGAAVGFGWDYCNSAKKKSRAAHEDSILLIVHCEPAQSKWVEAALRRHRPKLVGRVLHP